MPMTRLQTPRPSLLAWRVHGRLSEDDLDAASRAVTEAFDAQDEVDVLIDLAGWEATDPAAAFSTEIAAAQVRSVRHVRRYAVVGAPRWAAAMIRGFGTVLPLEARTFDAGEADAAWRWIDGGAPPSAGA